MTNYPGYRCVALSLSLHYGSLFRCGLRPPAAFTSANKLHRCRSAECGCSSLFLPILLDAVISILSFPACRHDSLNFLSTGLISTVGVKIGELLQQQIGELD
jgi:hypothetical protein